MKINVVPCSAGFCCCRELNSECWCFSVESNLRESVKARRLLCYRENILKWKLIGVCLCCCCQGTDDSIHFWFFACFHKTFHCSRKITKSIALVNSSKASPGRCSDGIANLGALFYGTLKWNKNLMGDKRIQGEALGTDLQPEGAALNVAAHQIHPRAADWAIDTSSEWIKHFVSIIKSCVEASEKNCLNMILMKTGSVSETCLRCCPRQQSDQADLQQLSSN